MLPSSSDTFLSDETLESPSTLIASAYLLVLYYYFGYDNDVCPTASDVMITNKS